MASYVEDLEARVRSLADLGSNLRERLTQVEHGQRELIAHLEQMHLVAEAQRAELQRLAEAQREMAVEMRVQVKEMVQAQQRLQHDVAQMLLPIKEQLGKVEGKLEGKREATTLMVTALLSGLGVLVSGLMGFLNLQARLQGK